MGTDNVFLTEVCTQFKKAWPLWISMAIAWLLTLAYSRRPDALAAVTAIPAWGWLVLFVPVIPFFRRKYRFPATLCGLLWLVFVLACVEEPRPLLRGLLSPAEPIKPQNAIRVITFNCSGQPAALKEASSWNPDIVLLQESPPREIVEHFARTLFGENGVCVWDIDTSIVAKGNLRSLSPEAVPPFFSLAVLRSPDIGDIQLVSLRLWTGIPCIELWNPQCWRRQRDLRLAQLKQMRQVVALLDSTQPLIIGGDFNAPQGDKVYSLLPDTLHDSFDAEGRGMGNTIMNDMPLMRIDQIWVSDGFETLQSFAVQSDVSDHRMVVSDVRAKTERPTR